MQRKGIERRNIVRQCSVPGDLPRFRDQSKSRRRQCRHMQRLANVASGVRAAGVLMDKGATSREIEQRHAPQYRQSALQTPVPENRFPRVHTPLAFSVTGWTYENASWLL